MTQNYLLLISIIKRLLREGKVIEAYEELQELERLNDKHLKEERKENN